MKTKKKFGMRRHIGITAAATLIALGATACEEAYWGKTDGESNKGIYEDFVKHFGSKDGRFSATLVKEDNENCLLNKAQGGKLDCRVCKPNDSKCDSCIEDAERDGCDDFQALIELDSILDYKILLSDGDGKKTEAMIAMCSSWSDKNHTIKIELDKYGQVNLVDGVKIGDDTTAITDICTLDKEICDGKFKKLTCDSVSYYSIGQDGKYSKCENGKCSDITLPSIEMPPVFLSGFNYRVCPVGYDYRTEYVYDLRNVCVKSTCNNASVNLYTDNLNCGGCGIVCENGVICENGNCKDTCKSDQILCNGQCIDPQTDNRYCGAQKGCTNYTNCPSGNVCSVGECSESCISGQILCNGQCIIPDTDNLYCGAKEGCKEHTSCSSGTVCSGGECRESCLSGQILCNGQCIDPDSDNRYCGAKEGCTESSKCKDGEVCSGGKCGVTCVSGQILCNGQCIDPTTDNRYCGAKEGCTDYIGCPSGQSCSNGQCKTSCLSDQALCRGKCINPQTDNAYCGAKGTCSVENKPDDSNYRGVTCPSGQFCSNGKCQTSCLSDQALCGGKCINPQTDNANCGAKGNCTGDDSTKSDYKGKTCPSGQFCSNGKCQTSCLSDQALCGGKCINPQTDNAYCGAKGTCSVENIPNDANYRGKSCENGQVCSGGSCSLTCEKGKIICGGKCVDPYSDNTFCGARGKCTASGEDKLNDPNYAGKACADGTKCSEGRCVVTCTSNQIVCGNECIDPKTNNKHCGASGSCNQANGDNYKGDDCNDATKYNDGDYVCIDSKCTLNTCINVNDIPCTVTIGDKTERRCVNVYDNNNQHCGGCNVKCESIKIPESKSAECVGGLCTVTECNEGSHPSSNGLSCELDTIYSCGSDRENCVIMIGLDTSDLINNVECSGGQCKAKACKTGYHLSNDQCVVDTREACGAEPMNCTSIDNLPKSNKEEAVDCVAGKCLVKNCGKDYQVSEDKTKCEKKKN